MGFDVTYVIEFTGQYEAHDAFEDGTTLENVQEYAERALSYLPYTVNIANPGIIPSCRTYHRQGHQDYLPQTGRVMKGG